MHDSAPPPQLIVTVYPDRYKTKDGEQWRFTWRELVAFCSAPGPIPPGGKDALPFWHGAELIKGGARRNADVIATHVMFLDVDERLDDALANLLLWGVYACAFPSPSGKPDRGRILIPLAQPINAAEHKQLWRICNARLGGMLDRQCIAPSHGFYTPAIADPARWYIKEFGAEYLDPADFDLRDQSKPIRAPSTDELLAFDYATRMREVGIYVKQLQSAQKGQRHARLFKLAQVCLDYALATEEMRQVVLDYNNACEDPKPADVIERDIISKAARYRRNAIGCALTAAVKVYTDHLRTLERMLELLREHVEDLYVRDGTLCELVETCQAGAGAGATQASAAPATETHRFVEVERARLHSLLTHYVHCYTWDTKKEEWHKGAIPPWAAEEILAMPTLERYLRPVVGVASAPQLRPDGTVLCTQGFDPATRLVYVGETIDLPQTPSRAEALEALETLDNIFWQFPWDSDVSRSVYLAYLLTAVGRAYLDGPIPVGIFDATHKQSGKSKLANCIAIVATGVIANSEVWPTAETRMQETLHTRCVADGRIVLFDNVRNGCVLESPELDGALTQQRISRRRYFTQQPWDVVFRPIVLVTGNGISLGGDLRPRATYLRLTPDTDAPEQRTDLEIPDLYAFVTRNRLDICRALLTIWLAWIAAGRPGAGELPPWHTVAWGPVREALVWLGRPDPFLCSRALRAKDSGADLHTRLISWLQQHGPLTSNGLLESLQPRSFGFGAAKGPALANGVADARAELWAALCQEAKRRAGEMTVYEVSWIMRRLVDAPHGGSAIRRDEKGRWYVAEAGAGAGAGQAS